MNSAGRSPWLTLSADSIIGRFKTALKQRYSTLMMDYLMRKYALLAALVPWVVLRPLDCDLHAQDPSFITKLSCATSGGYRQQVDQKNSRFV